MADNPVPAERIQELQAIVDKHGGDRIQGLSCDDIKAKLDQYYGDAVNDFAAGASYLFYFFLALIKHCPCLSEDPYHVKDPFTDPFQLQMGALPWDNRGSKVYLGEAANDPYLYSNNTARKGAYDPAKDQRTIFRVSPTPLRVGNANLQAYHLIAQDGRHAGKALYSFVGGSGERVIGAREFDLDNPEPDPSVADLWTLSAEYTAKNNNECVGRAIDNYTGDGVRTGVLDVPDSKGGRSMIIWDPWNGNCNETWHFRPTGYTD
ncbi:hypothetical protein [Streptomyces olivoreticuli]|uniref:hypothetical protein n=1 Tax=Streptomyces olivoreticuli TaxID=68246 RepID=UPI000E25E9B6|nr:hypothetical protein [Streptomyces olivoreticuli]